MNVITPSSFMKTKPDETSELETECLFGEAVQLLDSQSEWSYCKLLTDNYLGWVKKKDLGFSSSITHRVVTNRSFLLEKNDIKSNPICYLPLGAQLSVKKIKSQWSEVRLSKNDNQKLAFIPSNHIIKIDDKVKDWVGVAEELIGTPYRWGGRNSIGLDCSALLQLSYQTFGQYIPRNTNDQISLQKEIVTDIDKLKRGFVVFWKGHVGIMVDELNCIHANAYHMKTIVEPLHDIIFRMGSQYPIIKIMNFNNKI
jgi:hypothetical protein